MTFRLLALVTLMISTASFANGRSPAVEDFVGIEVDHQQVAPQGTESLYNLEQDLNQIQEQKKARNTPKLSTAPAEEGWGVKAIFAITLALGLPLVLWLMMMSHLKRKASVESASNLEVLEKYRKEREKKQSEEIKKAS